MKTWIGFQTLVWREIVRFISVFKQTIFPPIVSSFLFIFVFGFSLGSRIREIQGIPYLTYMIPGLVMMYVIEGAYANTSSSLFISKWANNIEELLVTPLSYFEMVLAILIGGLARSLVCAAGVYLVSLIFDRTPMAHPGVVLYFLIFVSLIFSSLGMIVALMAEEFEHLTVATTFIITPLTYFGGVFYSISMLPGFLKGIAFLNPMLYMISGIRYGMLGISDGPVGLSMTVTLTLFIVLFAATVFLFRIGYKLRK